MGISYYPSCVVNLRARFDEAFSVAVPSNTLDAVGAEELVDSAAVSPPTVVPLLLEGQQDQISWVMGRVPIKATVELPAYRQAGKFSIVLPYVDFPFDPRLFRAVGVEIHLGCVEAGAWGRGQVGTLPSGARESLLQTRDASGRINQETVLMVGVVDEIKVEHRDKGSEVTLEGRDLRGLMLDSPMEAKTWTVLDFSKNIVELVSELVAKHPLGARVTVATTLQDWTNGLIPSPLPLSSQNATPRVNKGKKGQKPTIPPPGDKGKTNFWDAITHLCFLCGAIPYFSGEILMVRSARGLYDLANRAGEDPSIRTPFVDGQKREVPGVGAFGHRIMVYGANVSSLSFTRNLQGMAGKAKVVEIVGYSGDQPAGSRRYVVRYPDEKTRRGLAPPTTAERTSVAPSGKLTQKDLIRIPPIYGVGSEEQAKVIAQAVYEEIGRQEIGGAVETKHLASLGGGNSDPDLVRLRPGAAVELLTNARELSSRVPITGALIDDNRRSLDAQIASVAQKIGDPALARVVVLTARGAVLGLSNFFRVANVKFDIGKQGIGVAFDFQNYVEALRGVESIADEIVGPPTQVRKTKG